MSKVHKLYRVVVEFVHTELQHTFIPLTNTGRVPGFVAGRAQALNKVCLLLWPSWSEQKVGNFYSETATMKVIA